MSYDNKNKMAEIGGKGKGKGKFRPRTGYEDPEGE